MVDSDSDGLKAYEYKLGQKSESCCGLFVETVVAKQVSAVVMANETAKRAEEQRTNLDSWSTCTHIICSNLRGKSSSRAPVEVNRIVVGSS